MTPDTAALRALADDATPGPWTTYRDGIGASAWVVVDDGTDLYAEGSDPCAATPVCMIESDSDSISPDQGDADAAFIAALDPDTVRALCDAADEVERLRKAVWASEEIDRRAGMLAGVQAERDASRTAHAALVAGIETGLRESACAECDHDRCATYRSAASWVRDYAALDHHAPTTGATP